MTDIENIASKCAAEIAGMNIIRHLLGEVDADVFHGLVQERVRVALSALAAAPVNASMGEARWTEAQAHDAHDVLTQAGWNPLDVRTTPRQSELVAALRERDEHLRLKNQLVLAAYPAMDAVDAIRKWCDEQRY